MRKEKVIKTLKITANVLLNIIFVLGVAIIPFYYSITALTEPETVAMVIQQVDYERVVETSPSIKSTLQKYDITPQEADSIMKSEQAGDLVEIYADELTQTFLNIPDDKVFDVDYMKKVVGSSSQRFADMVEEDTNLQIKGAVVKEAFGQLFVGDEAEVKENLTFIKTVKDVVTTIHTSSVVKNSLTVWGAAVLVMIAFILIAAIIALMRSNGFLWIGVDFAVITMILCIVIAFSKSGFVSGAALNLSDFGTQVVESAISISTEKIIIAVFGCAIFTALFIGFFVLVKLLKRQYQKPEKADVS